MPPTLQGALSVLGRVLLCAIFVMTVVGQKIPNYRGTAAYMAENDVPAPEILLAGAIVFLLVGSASVVVGYKARLGALPLLVFLALASYYFHDFWDTMRHATEQARQQQRIHFLKNLGLMGAMLFLIANGPGAWSLDSKSGRGPA